MLHRRPTITIATSALIFLCIALHAQTGVTAQKSVPYNAADAYKIYESLLPADWTVNVAAAQLSPVAFNADSTFAVVSMGHRCGSRCGAGNFRLLEKKDGVWKNLHWKGTSRAWAS
ncbi:MAG: hypothetical protein ABI177_01875 [Edaphobacter sp.]